MMTIDQIVNSLEKLSKGTDFLFKISENKNEEIQVKADWQEIPTKIRGFPK